MHSLTFSLSLTGADARTRARDGGRASNIARSRSLLLRPAPPSLGSPPFTPPAAPIPRGARYYLKKGGLRREGEVAAALGSLCASARRGSLQAQPSPAAGGAPRMAGRYQPPARSFSRPRRAAARRKSLLSSRKSLLSSALSLAARYSARSLTHLLQAQQPLMQGALPPATRNHAPVPAATPGALPPAPRGHGACGRQHPARPAACMQPAVRAGFSAPLPSRQAAAAGSSSRPHLASYRVLSRRLYSTSSGTFTAPR